MLTLTDYVHMLTLTDYVHMLTLTDYVCMLTLTDFETEGGLQKKKQPPEHCQRGAA